MYVIYRSWNQGILGKSVRHVAEPTVLDWVRNVWSDAGAQDPYDWLTRELGTTAYGLDRLFSEGGPAPQTMQELRTLARTRLPESYQCNVDEHSVRVLANGLDYDVAYYLVDDAAVAANPERWSFAVHDGPLPEAASPPLSTTAFTAPLQVTDLTDHPPSGEGTVYAVLLTCKAKHDSIGWNPTHALPGVRLPQFGVALRDLDTSTDEWPLELEVLRALVAPDEDGIAAALERCNRWPEYRWLSGEQPHPPRSHIEALRLLDTIPPERERHRERTVIQVGEHVAQMFIHDGYDDFEQWFLFDDRWTGTHPDLAASLIWFAYHWDPLCSRRHMYLTPCSDNRIRYVAVVGEDGQVQVREAEFQDEPRVWDLRRWSYEKRPSGGVTAGEVLGTVEIQFQQPSLDLCKFTDFRITRTRHGQAVAAMLARRIRHDLQDAGITRATGWLPEEYLYQHSRRFLRTLGEIHEPADGPSVLFIQ
ncbi:hypothetical protein ACFOY2_39615 [Nonomuraea purpurea]|uniref:GNAT family N-acetyltransferase n=1 Tax=Nonomuraea purpurea TaxID=1849276 RepID=A0ABV8GKG0_9ACTN